MKEMINKLRYISEKAFNIIPRQFRPCLIHYVRLLFTRIQSQIIHKGRDLPIAVCIESNSACNRHCSYCPRPERTTVMETETYYLIIDQLKKWGFQGRISPHSFNEPLTDKRIFDLMSYTRKNLPKSEIVLYTNGDLLDEKTIKKLDVDQIKVTLHEPNSQDRINRLKKYNVSITDLRDRHRTIPLSNRGGSIKLSKTEKYPSCYNIEIMIIRATGNVILCCQDAKEEYIMGNVKRQSVESIWNSYKGLRAIIRKGKSNLLICQRCGYEQL